MSQQPTLTLEEVAAALAMTVHAFRHRRAALHAAGFPRPLPAAGPRWSRAQAEAWIAAGGEARGRRAAADFVEISRKALVARYNNDPRARADRSGRAA